MDVYGQKLQPPPSWQRATNTPSVLSPGPCAWRGCYIGRGGAQIKYSVTKN